MKKRSKKSVLNINIHLTNKWLYTLIAIGVLIIVSVGIYAFGTSSPSTFGHSAGELDLSAGVEGNAVFNGVVTANAGINTSNIVLKTKVIEIGAWNMDTTASVTVAHGLDYTKIRLISVLIRPDSAFSIDNIYGLPLEYVYGSSYVPSGLWQIRENAIYLGRTSDGIFKTFYTSFDSTSVNRGYITITYEA